MTAEDYAPYGVGEPDAEGWYPDYRIPAELREPAPVPKAGAKSTVVAVTWLGLVERWRLVLADLALHSGVDLYDPAIRDRPFPGVRTMIFSLLDSDTRLRRSFLPEVD